MLEVNALGKRFGAVQALDQVSFSLEEGEIVGLLGENGAGKTTTLRLLSGALVPDSGRVTIGGRDLFSDRVMTRRKVGYLPEQLPLDERMRVRPFLDYVARLRGLNRAERTDGIERVLHSCALEELADRGIGVLSRGGRMRVALAQALVHNPEVLLLDEPTAGLDPQQVLNMRRLILSLSGHHTILFSSHNLTEVAAVCNRIVFLKQGRLVAEDVLSTTGSGGGEMLFLRFSSAPEDIAALLAAMPVVSAVETVPGGGPGGLSVHLKQGDGGREQLAERVTMMGWGLCEMRPMSGNLTAFFQHHAADIPQELGGDDADVVGDELAPETSHTAGDMPVDSPSQDPPPPTDMGSTP